MEQRQVLLNCPCVSNRFLLIKLSIMFVQAQAYGGIFNNSGTNPPRAPSFGSVFNCQSYFTTVPLMGVVTVVILLLILYCSIVFLFSIRTIDRFDDPRGPTISVENLH